MGTAHGEQVKARLARWLEPRGLSFNEDKTRVVTTDQRRGPRPIGVIPARVWRP